MDSYSFVPENFAVPLTYTADGFVIKKLSPAYTVIDYAAVMNARTHIRHLLDCNSPEQWPQENLTYKKNREDLVMHEKEFDGRIAFAYTVLSPDEAACLGCIYMDPSGVPAYDAEITLWALTDEMDSRLYRVVREWVKAWPFIHPAFPAFEIPMKEWREMLAMDNLK